MATLDNLELTYAAMDNLPAPNEHFWVGVYLVNGAWTTWDGSPLKWIRWRTNQPDGSPAPANCITFWLSDKGHGDRSCTDGDASFQDPSVCEVARTNYGSMGSVFKQLTGICINGEEIDTPEVMKLVECLAFCERNEECSAIAFKINTSCKLVKRSSVVTCFQQHEIHVWA